jgi:non-homologous end joining protein Ku
MDNELYDVEDKPTKTKFFIGERIASRFISLTCGGSKTYVRGDKIVQMYEADNRTHIFLDGSDTPCIVKESTNEIFAKIRGIY